LEKIIKIKGKEVISMENNDFAKLIKRYKRRNLTVKRTAFEYIKKGIQEGEFSIASSEQMYINTGYTIEADICDELQNMNIGINFYDSEHIVSLKIDLDEWESKKEVKEFTVIGKPWLYEICGGQQKEANAEIRKSVLRLFDAVEMPLSLKLSENKDTSTSEFRVSMLKNFNKAEWKTEMNEVRFIPGENSDL
jgi:hypothetical protein